jgi:hypothetical protein
MLVLLVLTSAPAMAQDSHLAGDPSRDLFGCSAFAHGYLHGYERGFHDGDLDLQLGHSRQDAGKMHDFREAKHEFKKEFGDRDMFVKGYQSGFRVGYADALDGLAFRAVHNLRSLAQDLPQVDPRAAPILDQAITHGYLDGVNSGLHDGRALKADYRPDGSDCELALRFKQPPTTFYCSAYSLGYRLGYSDGFHNQRPEPEPRRIAGER